MSDSRFLYVTYIRTSPEKLWEALLKPEFSRQYWFGCSQESDWRKGASWKLRYADGTLTDAGEVEEIDPPKKLVLKWRHERLAELKAEGESRASFTLEPMGEMVKLTVLHEMPRPGSVFIERVSNGWPSILSSLKSLLETGHALERPRDIPKIA